MRVNDKANGHCAGQSPDVPSNSADAGSQACRLAALAHEARLLEFALDGDGSAARSLATDLEAALENAMVASSAEEFTQAYVAIEAALDAVVEQGMRLSAQLADMEVEGVLGVTRMPVLTAVLTASNDPGATA